jgi:hypothetical protein
MFRSNNKKYNPFKSKVVDIECKNINKYCNDCIFEKDENKNIVKCFLNKDIYEWEVMTYLSLMDKSFIPSMEVCDLSIVYSTRDMVSLYNYLKKNKGKNIKMLLNELYGFIKYLMKFNFIHGNLHIHNIFINQKTFNDDPKFYLIDLSNSYKFKNIYEYPYVEEIHFTLNSTRNYWRTSFIGEYANKNDDKNLLYWDLFTLYISLKMYLKNDIGNLIYLENITRNYIKEEQLINLINDYQGKTIN